MQWLARICVKRPVFAAVLILVVVVIGAAGYFQLGVDQFPNIDVPYVTVTTTLTGASPEEIETDITQKVEDAVSTISGLDTLQSTSTEGRSTVTMGFVLEKSSDVAAQEVRDKLNRIQADLPPDAETPKVEKMDPDAQPILYVAVRTDRTIVEATEVAEKKIARALQGIAGVGSVEVLGGQARQVNVWLDPVALAARGLTASDVQGAIQKQNVSTPGGSVEAGATSRTLRVQGRVKSPAALGQVVVKQADGAPVRLADVARVEDGQAELSTLATVNGERTLLLTIRKQSGANTVTVVDAVKARLGAVERSAPPGYELEVIRDGAGVIRTSVDTVKEHLVMGAVLASLIVLLFLGSLRSALISALSIPVSLIGTFALMWWAGFTLNMITLLALALAVGIVIDDAIVVIENIHRFIEVKGMKPFPAAIAATRDVGLAVLATSLSLMAVFLPVAFMSGIIGRFMRGFGVTMAAAIGISVLVSFTLAPSMAARLIPPVKLDAAGLPRHERGRLQRAFDRLYLPLERGYMALLGWVLRRRWVAVVASVAVLASSVPLLGVVRKSFLPDNDEARFQVNVRTPEGTGVTATSLVAERIARELRQLPGVALTSTTIGDDGSDQNLAKIYVALSDPATRKESQQELMALARSRVLARQPKELQVNASELSMGGGSTPGGVTYTFTGPDLSQLAAYAKKAAAELAKVPGAVDVGTSWLEGKPELVATVDRDKAADLGVQVGDVASTLQLLVGGRTASSYAEGGEQYDVYLRAEPRYRVDAEGLGLITVPSSTHGTVSLRDVVSLREGSGPATIRRDARQRQITVYCNLAPGYAQSDVQGPMERIVAGLGMPSSYRAVPSGMTKEMGKTMLGFAGAILLSLVFMYLVLAAQFESWLHPFTIMLALPLTFPFALLSLVLFHGSLNAFTLLGVLVLFGIVKKNSILQVDHTNTLRREGMEREAAILQANRDRLRPILMTTLAFVAGMVPLAFSRGIGAGQSKAIGAVVIGGQTLSLLLTLLAIPVAYSLFDDAGAWLRRRRAGRAQVDRGEKEVGAAE
jgi:hydrophobe/amphiphile efflux-1 (HAE1) family protein